MLYKAILFDLDGTLVDTKPGIICSFLHTFEQFGVSVPEQKLQSCLGPPLRESFARFLPLEKVEKAVTVYRSFYEHSGLTGVFPFAGVSQMLTLLQCAGLPMAVATSKEERAAYKVLQQFQLDGFFQVIAGARADAARDGKEAVIRHALAADVFTGLADKEIVMVGDRMHDMQGAKACGIAAAGVLYGYAAPGELEAYRPAYLAQTVQQLTQWLLASCHQAGR